MSQRKRIYGVILFALCFCSGWYLLVRSPEEQYRNIFINETMDHRFDESIQVSILAAHRRTGVQNAVIITDRIPEVRFEEEAVKIFRKLGVGKLTRGKGILYLFSPKSRALKIEVGYSLEGVLPDVKVHFLERAAKSFTFSERYQDFWAELINTLNIEIAKSEERGSSKRESFPMEDFRFSGGGGIAARDYTLSLEQLESEIKRLPKNENTLFDASEDPHVTVERYLQSLQAGIGDALPLLSPESQWNRLHVPMTSYQLKRNGAMYSQAGIDRLFIDGDFVFVFFKPRNPVLPIVLVRNGKLWKVQEGMALALFQRFEDSMSVFLKFPLEAENVDLNAYIKKNFKNLYALPRLNLNSLKSTSDEIEKYYFHHFALDQVLSEIEKIPMKKRSEDLIWIQLDAEQNLGKFSRFLQTMAELCRRRPHDLELKRNESFYRENYKFDGNDWVTQFP